jgi:dethiobiotin synthetase
MIPGLFVTGTDTGVGKTRVAAAIVRSLISSGHNVGVLKPIATGAVHRDGGWRCEDAEILNQAAGGNLALNEVVPILYADPVAPSVAARLAGERDLSFARIVESTRSAIQASSDRCELIVIEGTGGLLCPLANNSTVADLAIVLDFPLLIVARRGLGTLNHVLLTVEAARSRGLRVVGVILNGADATTNALAEATNADELSRRLGLIPVLADVPHQIEPEALYHSLVDVDWYQRALRPRWG